MLNTYNLHNKYLSDSVFYIYWFILAMPQFNNHESISKLIDEYFRKFVMKNLHLSERISDDCIDIIMIVLKPDFWGLGKILANDLIQKYRDTNLDKQLFIYLPLSRNVEIVADRFKFTLFGEIEIDGVNFAKLLINVGGEGFEPPTFSV
ncbi:MAG: hypothetical protein RJA96_1148 [Actinomycetota bacterium]